MKLEMSSRSKTGKLKKLWKLNSTLLSNQWIKEDVMMETLKYLENTENDNTT